MFEFQKDPNRQKPSRDPRGYIEKHGVITPREHRHSGKGLGKRYEGEAPNKRMTHAWQKNEYEEYNRFFTLEARQKADDQRRLADIREGLDMAYDEMLASHVQAEMIKDIETANDPDSDILSLWNTLKQAPSKSNYSAIPNPTYYQEALQQIDVIGSFAGLVCTTSDGTHIGDYARTLIEQQEPHHFYQPEAFVGRMLAIANKQTPQDYRYREGIGTILRESGALSSDPSERQPHLINLFYTYANLYCESNGIEYTTNYAKDTYPPLLSFPFRDELFAEYQRKPDGRFGDGLLVACSLYEQSMRQEAA